MSIKHFPDIPRSLSAFNVMPASNVKLNTFSNIETVFGEAGDRWLVTLGWEFLTSAQVREIRAFLLGLKGQVNRCYITDTAHSNLGSWLGSPVVDGANQYGTILNIKGLAASALIAKAGDRFTLNGRLHELVEDATSDIYGKAQLRFEPEILYYPADAQPLIVEAPYSTFYLADPKQIPDFSHSARGVKNVTIKFMESLRP